jgi:hypothetical protein
MSGKAKQITSLRLPPEEVQRLNDDRRFARRAVAFFRFSMAWSAAAAIALVAVWLLVYWLVFGGSQ